MQTAIALPRYGAISVAQRSDGAVRLNVHYHILAADGAWVQTPEGVAFLPAPPLHQNDVEAVFANALRRIAMTNPMTAFRTASPPWRPSLAPSEASQN